MDANKVVQGSECAGNLGLNMHVILGSDAQNLEPMFEYPKNVLDDILGLRVP